MNEEMQVPPNLTRHCIFPNVSHIQYADYIVEEDEVKKRLMLKINWTTKEKMKHDRKIE